MLEPRCLNDPEHQTAMLSTGVIIPCCHCDNVEFVTSNGKPYQRAIDLLAVSNIKDSDNVSDILTSGEWKGFEEDLRDGVASDLCRAVCDSVLPRMHKISLAQLD